MGLAKNGDKWKTTQDQHVPAREIRKISQGQDQELSIDNTSTTKDLTLKRGSTSNENWPSTETNELGPNLRQEFIVGDIPDFKAQPKLKDLFNFEREYTGTEWKVKKKFVYWDVTGESLCT